MTMKKILLAGACAGLLAISAAPALSAGPMISGTGHQSVNRDAVQKAEHRGDRWRGYWGYDSPRRHYYAPRYGHGYWGHRRHYAPRDGYGYSRHRHYYAPRYGYHRPYYGNFGYWR